MLPRQERESTKGKGEEREGREGYICMYAQWVNISFLSSYTRYILKVVKFVYRLSYLCNEPYKTCFKDIPRRMQVKPLALNVARSARTAAGITAGETREAFYLFALPARKTECSRHELDGFKR